MFDQPSSEPAGLPDANTGHVPTLEDFLRDATADSFEGRMAYYAQLACDIPGHNVNETLPDGTSALVTAVQGNNYEAGAFLLDSGIDPDHPLAG